MRKTFGFGCLELRNYLAKIIYKLTGLNYILPTDIYIMLTSRCNSRCIMCNEWKMKAFELPKEKWFSIIDDLVKFAGPYAKINFSGGEVLTWKEGLEIVEYCAAKNFGTGIVTNGFLINKSVAKKLLNMNLFNINISVDGLDPETHDFFRGFKGAGERVFKALDVLLEEKKKLSSNTRIILKTVVARQNIDEIAPLIKWAAKHKLDGISFQPITQTFGEKENLFWFEKSPLWPKKQELPEMEKAIDEIIILKKKGYSIYNPIEALKAFKSYFRDPNGLNSNNVCSVGSNDFTIYCNGEIIFCGKFPVVGKLGTKNSNIKKIWHGGKAKEVRKKIKACKKKCLLTCYTKYSLLEKIKLFFKSS